MWMRALKHEWMRARAYQTFALWAVHYWTLCGNSSWIEWSCLYCVPPLICTCLTSSPQSAYYVPLFMCTTNEYCTIVQGVLEGFHVKCIHLSFKYIHCWLFTAYCQHEGSRNHIELQWLGLILGVYHTCQRPGISGKVPETDLVSCCPGNIQNSPGNIHVASTEYYTIKYRSNRNRMLAGSGSMPATGWMPVGEKFGTIAQGMSKHAFLTCSKYLIQNEPQSVYTNTRVGKYGVCSHPYLTAKVL